jgi:hypothetical protein
MYTQKVSVVSFDSEHLWMCYLFIHVHFIMTIRNDNITFVVIGFQSKIMTLKTIMDNYEN